MAIELSNDQLDRIRSVHDLQFLEDFHAKRAETIRILAEGDSWFAYPRQFLIFGKDANILDHLKEKSGLVITDLSSNGDEAVQMVTGDSKLDFLDRVSSGEYDLILFSGGGNDIVGRFDFEFFLKQKTREMTWVDCIEEERLSRRLEMIRNAYIDLIDLVKLACNKTGVRIPPIITHTYDLAIPMEDGAIFLGGLFKVDGGRSWMHPFLMKSGIADADDQKAIVRHILNKFGDLIDGLGNQYDDDRFKVIDTRNTIEESDWLNEIHPTSEGFRKIANRIYNEGIVPAVSN